MDNDYDPVMDSLEWFYLPQHVDVTGEVIENLERRLGARLPLDYRHFLKKYSVSSQKKIAAMLDINDPSRSVGSVRVFYGINRQGDVYDLETSLQRFADRLPAGYLPIADSPGGKILLAYSGPNQGKVYCVLEAGSFLPTNGTRFSRTPASIL